MKKIIFALIIGILLTIFTNWISSREIKNEAKAKEEVILKEKAELMITKKWDAYIGNWTSQESNSTHIVVKKGNCPAEPLYTITVQQKNIAPIIFSLKIKHNGEGQIINNKGITYHIEFTHFYEKSNNFYKPSIEFYSVSNGIENGLDKNIFIRAFRSNAK